MYDITNDIKVARVCRCNDFFTGLTNKNNEKNSLESKNTNDNDDITFLDVFMDVHFGDKKENIEKTQK